MKRIIFALCLLIAVTSCVSKKKYMVAENGRLAALSRERVLNRGGNTEFRTVRFQGIRQWLYVW